VAAGPNWLFNPSSALTSPCSGPHMLDQNYVPLRVK
jgi:hypothetical protein